jgi:hypothetical protein
MNEWIATVELKICSTKRVLLVQDSPESGLDSVS